MQVWWVNHNKTFREEVDGGFLWSPQTKRNGRRSHFYDNMTQARPGDIVFSFAKSHIQAIGVVTAFASDFRNPFPPGPEAQWHAEGWLVPVNFQKLSKPLRPKEHMGLLGQHLNYKYAPLDHRGNGNQGAYLSLVEAPFARALEQLLGADFDNTLALIGANLLEADEAANEAERQIGLRTDLPPTEVLQLVKARRGQGVYRLRLQRVESRCRITGLELQQHLVASHIKPWAVSNDFEKTDGNNGLLLSPHVDHLFDRGYISFSDTGRVLLSPKLQFRVLSTWKIDPDQPVGTFSPEQCSYLRWHRKEKLGLSA